MRLMRLGWITGAPLALLFAIGLAACHSAAGAKDEGEGSSRQILKVERGDVERTLLVDGLLFSPTSKPAVVQRVQWYWNFTVAWTAEEGTMVKRGDPIVRLDPAAIQKDLAEKEIELDEEKLRLEEVQIKGRDQVAEALADVTQKEFEVKKAQLLVVEDETVSLNERKKQRLAVAEAKEALVRAKDKVGAARLESQKDHDIQALKVDRAVADVTEIKTGLAKLELTAPQDGLLIFPLYSSDSGWQKARPGAAVGINVAIAEVADPKELVARLFIPEVDADGIVAGVPAMVALDITPTEVIAAKITRVASVPSTPAERDGTKSQAAAQNVRQFEVLATLDHLPKLALPGLSVRARITTVKRDHVLRVPIEVLRLAGAGKDDDDQPSRPVAAGSTNVVVLARRSAGDPWQSRQLKLGALSLAYAEVLEGLAEGEDVRAVR